MAMTSLPAATATSVESRIPRIRAENRMRWPTASSNAVVMTSAAKHVRNRLSSIRLSRWEFPPVFPPGERGNPPRSGDQPLQEVHVLQEVAGPEELRADPLPRV